MVDDPAAVDHGPVAGLPGEVGGVVGREQDPDVAGDGHRRTRDIARPR
ncbi:hypothetical protein OG786_17580 [Streptomyces sp. NBC_00101]